MPYQWVAPDDTPTRLLDFKYAIALIENRIPLEGPVNREPLRQRVERLKAYEANMSRLIEERDGHKRGAALLATTAANNLARAEAAEAEVSRLREALVTEEAGNGLLKRALVTAEAEVSRLREALELAERRNGGLRESLDVKSRALHNAEADVSRLQQENALLRRSLEVLSRDT
jgi:chromosome segregation ATPase